MGKNSFASLFVFCYIFQSVANGYRILGVFPSSSRSHYIVGSALMRGLADRGHEVSVITPFAGNDRIENFEEIPIPEVLEYFKDLHDRLQKSGDRFFFQIFKDLIESGRTASEIVLQQPIVQELLTSPNRTFDLIICEIFVTDALFGFAQHFNAPVIGISPMGNSLWASVLTGAPTPPSFVPNIFLGNTDRMSFIERATNLAALTIQYLGYHHIWLPYQSEVYDRFFPNARTSLAEVLKNVSLVLLNQHVSIGNPEPLLHNMIEIGGLHIEREVKPLPSQIKEFLDNATHGAIYFALGTNLRSESLRRDKLEAILNTFKALKQRVVWKYENTSLPNKSENILIGDWLPQNDILAHPNVKLFITHGGLLGTTESVYHAKPMLGIPHLFDQFVNMARAVGHGFALTVPYAQLNAETLKAAIEELLTNPQYTRRAKLASELYRDQPMEPLATAVYWVEYVLRHSGAPHLRSVALDLGFIQYHSLDTVFVVFGGFLFLVYLLGRLLKQYASALVGFKEKKE